VEDPSMGRRKVTVWLDDDIARLIRILAMARGVSVSSLIRSMIESELRVYDVIYGFHKESDT